jgi:hypothetical protein
MAAQGPFSGQNTYAISFFSTTGNKQTFYMPKDTSPDFLVPIASGFWPGNALNFDIFITYGGSRSIFWSKYLCTQLL